MQRHSTRSLLAAWMLVPALLMPSHAMGAEQADRELDEIMVNSVRVKPTRDPHLIVNWLKLLVGKFRCGGFFELRGEGMSRDLLVVRGAGDCPDLPECTRTTRITPRLDGRQIEM
jgi:hypothetical protein